MKRVAKVPQYSLHPSSGQAWVRLPMGKGERKAVFLGVHGTPESRKRYDEVIAAWLKGIAVEQITAKPSDDGIPPYCCHAATGRGYCTPPGFREIYFGEHGTPEAEARYNRFIAEWLANNRVVPPEWSGVRPELRTINVVVAEYWGRIDAKYRGRDASEPGTVRSALRPLLKLYGDTPIADFGPLKLEAVRHEMCKLGWCRNYINQQTSRIKSLFKWAESREYVPAGKFNQLCTLAGLREGEADVPEGKIVRPVQDSVLEATKPFASRIIRAMAEVQRLTGMRPGELCIMRGCLIDQTGNGNPDVWIYTPDHHKNKHRQKQDGDKYTRRIVVNKAAQAILKPFLEGRNPEDYLFKPEEAVLEVREARREARKTNVQPSQQKRAEMWASRTPREFAPCYTTTAYRIALQRAAKRADRAAKKKNPEAVVKGKRLVPSFHPHQIRHTAGTEVRNKFGLDAAQAFLGHTHARTTEVYAEVSLDKAIEAARAIG